MTVGLAIERHFFFPPIKITQNARVEYNNISVSKDKRTILWGISIIYYMRVCVSVGIMEDVILFPHACVSNRTRVRFIRERCTRQTIFEKQKHSPEDGGKN